METSLRAEWATLECVNKVLLYFTLPGHTDYVQQNKQYNQTITQPRELKMLPAERPHIFRHRLPEP